MEALLVSSTYSLDTDCLRFEVHNLKKNVNRELKQDIISLTITSPSLPLFVCSFTLCDQACPSINSFMVGLVNGIQWLE